MDLLKPQLKTRAVPLLQGVKGLALSRIAEEVLIRDARIDSEGGIDSDGGTDYVYRGSTLLTIELEKIGLGKGLKKGSQSSFLRAIRYSLRLHVRLMRLARREAERRSEPSLLTGMSVDTDFRIEGDNLLVDIDVECPLAVTKTLDDRTREGQV